ncbi:MAG TPA: phosphoribosylglycinamide formyltransferase [Baekduia sp.]|uniref:phosphoribosylglycinamide formyltransferase n=1 Tax=Baekduia sp. TaxID=2600305 RepID=UPI002CC781ED|nr:phosphoribosylglycinamide formyltransferase [Baekduia sp.]HMJ35731.1 phosphoribosylglycinamide formyltransferase [Baekduia sp.]
MAGLLRVGVLASGGGTNLQALLDGVHDREARIVALATDQVDAPALERARRAAVPASVFPRDAFPDRATRDAAIGDWLEAQGVELVVLAGYMAILDGAFIARFRDRVVNVHPSLLPSFAGLGAVEQALAYGVKVFGVTVHFVDEGVDTGAIILQRSIDLPDATDADEVLAALRPLEYALLPDAVRLIAAGRVRRDPAHARRVVVDP